MIRAKGKARIRVLASALILLLGGCSLFTGGGNGEGLSEEVDPIDFALSNVTMGMSLEDLKKVVSGIGDSPVAQNFAQGLPENMQRAVANTKIYVADTEIASKQAEMSFAFAEDALVGLSIRVKCSYGSTSKDVDTLTDSIVKSIMARYGTFSRKDDIGVSPLESLYAWDYIRYSDTAYRIALTQDKNSLSALVSIIPSVSPRAEDTSPASPLVNIEAGFEGDVGSVSGSVVADGASEISASVSVQEVTGPDDKTGQEVYKYPEAKASGESELKYQEASSEGFGVKGKYYKFIISGNVTGTDGKTFPYMKETTVYNPPAPGDQPSGGSEAQPPSSAAQPGAPTVSSKTIEFNRELIKHLGESLGNLANQEAGIEYSQQWPFGFSEMLDSYYSYMRANSSYMYSIKKQMPSWWYTDDGNTSTIKPWDIAIHSQDKIYAITGTVSSVITNFSQDMPLKKFLDSFHANTVWYCDDIEDSRFGRLSFVYGINNKRILVSIDCSSDISIIRKGYPIVIQDISLPSDAQSALDGLYGGQKEVKEII